MPGSDALGVVLADQGAATQILQGVVVADATGALKVNVGGLTPSVRWLAGWAPVLGDLVRIVSFNGEMLVLPRLGAPGPTTGTVTSYAAGAATCMVTAAGVSYSCYRLSAYTPVVGHVVRLDWSEAAPFVLGQRSVAAVAPVIADPAIPVAPPGQASSGVNTYACTDSGYFSTSFGWSGGTSYGSRLMQGSSSGTNTGAWFYGAGPSELAGRTITRARVYVIRTNAYGASGASPAHLYGHTSAGRPGGNVALSGGPFDASLGRGGEGWFDVSTAVGAQVVAGGGLAISGTPYLVLEGVRERSNSGLLELTWSR